MYVQSGTNGPVINRWEDYLAARVPSSGSNTWIATAYTLQGPCSGGSGTSCINVEPRFVWFGRQRDFTATPTPTATSTPTPAPLSVSLTVSASTVATGGTLTVTWANIPNPTPRDWLAFFTPGSAQGWLGRWLYVDCSQVAGSSGVATGSCQMTAPSAVGTYDLRLLSNDSYTVLASLTITVAVPPPSLSARASSVAAGGTLTVTWANIANPTPRDWVAFFIPGSLANWVGHWVYVDCSQAPSTPGTYDLRLLANDSYTVLASTSITVT